MNTVYCVVAGSDGYIYIGHVTAMNVVIIAYLVVNVV